MAESAYNIHCGLCKQRHSVCHNHLNEEIGIRYTTDIPINIPMGRYNYSTT